MEIQGQITISRPYGTDCDYVSISIIDKNASIEFCEARIKYADFAEAITGHAYIPCLVIVRGLERVGKKMEHKQFEFKMPPNVSYGDRKNVALEEAKKLLSDGWIPDTGFNSQGSFFTRDGVDMARTTIRRYV